MDELARISSAEWELELAGAPQGAEGQRLVEELQARYSATAWWPRVHWRGWVKDPGTFLDSLDLLVCPSSEFDPFPTVLLEAGNAGVAVLGAGVGGVPEIVEDTVTGWLFQPQDWSGAARKLQQILEAPGMAERAGQEAKKRVEREFAMVRMVENYLKVYSDLKGI
jgi:glycosyltransferase involved in cell wall biosynthesis